jgi:hypothetical protein
VPVRGPLISRALRLQIGASVLSAARLVDTRLVTARLARFAREHRLYVETDRKVTAMARKLQAARAHLSRCGRVLAEAVEALACALIADGHQRRNPFARFKVPSPSVLVRLPFAGEARAVHRLVAAIRRRTPVGPRTSEAARAADEAARAIEDAIVAVAKVEPEVRVARRTRDAMRHGWHSAYVALRNGARAAMDDGAPDLHATLFTASPRARTKRRRRGAGRTAVRDGAAR